MRNRPYGRRSIRLKDYDYTSSGAYYVTICAHNRQFLFSKIINEEIILSKVGSIVEEEWMKIATVRDNILLDEYVIMPNHFHAILWIIENDEGTASRGTASCAPTIPMISRFGRVVPGSLSAIIRSFKSAVTNHHNKIQKSSKDIWQRNFYEHVIRDEQSLNRIREYIINNPLNWELDQENPERKGQDGFYKWLASFKDIPKKPYKP